MHKTVRIISLISFIEGIAAFLWLVTIPTTGETFSPIRLTSLLGILLASLGSLAFFIYTRSSRNVIEKLELFAKSGGGSFISLLLVGTAFSVWVSILYKEQLLQLFDEALYARLLPIAIFGALLSLQTGILLLIPNTKHNTWKSLQSVWKPALILLGCFLVVWAFMSLTSIGFIFDNVGLSWGPPGTPVTFAQVNLVLMGSLWLTFAYGLIKSRLHHQRLVIVDIVIFIALWGLAVILWSHTPVSETHFNPPSMAPNYETYPNSDALIFDRSAYHLLFGIGFSNRLIRRPLYVGMLALFHKLGGFGYENTIFLQILILAFIPALIYLLTSKLSYRLAGLVAGGLILLREKNAIELSNRIVTSNAKLMMSDMISMLGVVAFIYLVTKMLSERNRNIWLPAITGACLGLTALVRAQVFILIPPLLLFLILEKRPVKYRIQDSFLVIVGVILIMSPWVLRNWNLTGTFVLDDRGEEKLLARNYSEIPVGFPEYLPGETDKEYSARIKREIITYAIEHPSDVASFVSNHFFRNLATSVIYIAPLYSSDAPRSLVENTYFWDEWKGKLNRSNIFPLIATLALIAIGVSAAQTKDRLSGWFPLVAFIFYSGGNALVRSSGWRFSMPADWIILVYYSIALAYLPSTIKLVFDGVEVDETRKELPPTYRVSVWGGIVLGLLILAGASVPIAERLVPPTDLSNLNDEAKAILSQENILSLSEIESFLKQKNAVFYSGIALYPRYVTLKSRIYLAYAPEDYTFLHFWLINDSDNQIVLPLQSPPDSFKHTALVSIIGCQENNYIATWAVIEHSPETRVFVQEPRFPLSCPLPDPAQK